MVPTHSPEASGGGGGEGAGATSALQANLHLQSAKINQRCWLHQPPLGSSLIRQHHARIWLPAHPAGKPVSSTGRSGAPELRAPQRSHRTSSIPGKSLGHTSKAWGNNSCRQIGSMGTGTAEQFFLPLGKQMPICFTKIKRFVVGGSHGKGEPWPSQRVRCGAGGDLDPSDNPSPGEQTLTVAAGQECWAQKIQDWALLAHPGNFDLWHRHSLPD